MLVWKENVRFFFFKDVNPPSSQIASHLNKAPIKIQSLSLLIGFGMWQAARAPMSFLVSKGHLHLQLIQSMYVYSLRRKEDGVTTVRDTNGLLHIVLYKNVQVNECFPKPKEAWWLYLISHSSGTFSCPQVKTQNFVGPERQDASWSTMGTVLKEIEAILEN